MRWILNWFICVKLINYLFHTWHRLWRGEGRLGTVSRWEPSARWLGLVTLSVIINVDCWKSNFTIGSSSFDILQNKTKGSKVTPRHQWLYSLDQFIRREGCFEIFTIIWSSGLDYFPGYKYKGTFGIELDWVEVLLSKVWEFVWI